MIDESKPVNILNWGFCPFRGLPRVSLDDRCPTTLNAISLGVDTGVKTEDSSQQPPRKRGRPRKDEVRIPVEVIPTEEVTMLIPVLEEESYCDTCLYQKVREREAGVKFTVRDKSPERKKRGRPRKV